MTRVTRKEDERSKPFEKRLDLKSVWGHLIYAELVIISVKKEWFFKTNPGPPGHDKL